MKFLMCFHNTHRFNPLAILILILLSLLSSASIAADKENQAIRMVQEYGKDLGGGETIESLINIYMTHKKPNSEVGVNIRGWYSIQLEDATYLVFFSYIERELEKWKWKVQIESNKIKPLDEMAKSFLIMAETF
jgi:hypothetical protein